MQYISTAKTTIVWNVHVDRNRWKPSWRTHSFPIASFISSYGHLNPPLRAFTLCFVLVLESHFSPRPYAVQILGPKERATDATLSVECLIIVLFVAMGVRAMSLLPRNDDADDVDASTEKNALTGLGETDARRHPHGYDSDEARTPWIRHFYRSILLNACTRHKYISYLTLQQGRYMMFQQND